MAGEIKREDAGRITKKLAECRMHLQRENIYSCLTGFRDVLERVRTTPMLPVDAKQLQTEINDFQQALSASRAFRHLYGPVTFKDDDVETALDFMKQLIQIKDEEIAEAMEAQREEQAAAGEAGGLQHRLNGILLLVDKGEYDSARERAKGDEEAADALIEHYNAAGIQYRKDGDFDKAVATFKKALFVRPDDEGLHYNLARVHIEAGDLKAAQRVMEEILQRQPDFKEGQRLLAFIAKKLSEGYG